MHLTGTSRPHMKDTQLRGLLLQVFYDRRREKLFLPKAADLGVDVNEQDILQVCDQLHQHGMLDWISQKRHGQIAVGIGRINAFGIDVVEQEESPSIKVEFVKHQTINISGSNQVVIGDNNSQVITQQIHDLISFIDSANATNEQKLEAKGLLRRFLEHPLIVAIGGAAVTGLLDKGA